MNKPQLRLPIDDEIATHPEESLWRPIHYLGSKLRIAEPLKLAIDQLESTSGPVCDLFAGSGTVSAALSSSRDVVSVDIQEYSRVLCSAVLCPAEISMMETTDFLRRAMSDGHNDRLNAASPLIEYEENCFRKARSGDGSALCELIDHASILAFNNSSRQGVADELIRAHANTISRLMLVDKDRPAETLVMKHFGGLYFSYRQAVQLDSLLIAAHTLGGNSKDTLLAAIISTASDIVNTVGKHFAQPIRPRTSDGQPKRHLVAKILRDRETDVFSSFEIWLQRYRSLPKRKGKNQAIRGDFRDVLDNLDKRIKIVYADPPYTREHYSRFYHVLETMCVWDDPGVSTTRIRAESEQMSRGMYRADRHQSPFCIKSQAPGAFEALFAGVRAAGIPLVLSYSPYAAVSTARPRVMTVEQILVSARKYFRHVDSVSAGRITHSKLNSTRFNSAAPSEAELIILCS